MEEMKGGTNWERDLISWPLFLPLPMATSGVWSQPDVSGGGSSPGPQPGSKVCPANQGGPIAVGTGTLSLLLPTAVRLRLLGTEGQCRCGEQRLAFSLTQTHKQVRCSGRNWPLLCWGCKSGNNSWRFSALSRSRDEF